MTFLLDTNAVSDLIRENPKFAARLSALGADDSVATCSIVRGEILYGLERLAPGKRRDELQRKAKSVLSGLLCHSVPESAADQYARAKREAQARGKPLDTNDLWIAATAITLDATLVTRDADFEHAQGLRTENWTV